MTVIAKGKRIYRCLHVTKETKVGEVYEFVRSIGGDSQILINYPLPYWLVCEKGRGMNGIMRVSDKNFRKEYEVVE